MSSLQFNHNGSLSYYSPEYLPEGYVRLPWQAIYEENKIAPENLVVKDERDNVIPSQLFRVDDTDTSHDFLVISLRDISPDPQELSEFIRSLRIEQQEHEKQKNRGFPRLEIVLGPNDKPRGCGLDSGKLKVWFNLIPSPEDCDDDWDWYAGSATSVLVDNQELLEYFTNDGVSTNSYPYWLCHDPQKRCMQIDKIQVRDESNHSWSDPYNLFEQPYECIHHSIGSVGVSITIASTPFNYDKTDQNKKCQLYRVISLFKDTDYILEDLYLRKVGENTKNDELEFKVHYFTFMDLHFCRKPLYSPTKESDEEFVKKAFVMISCMPPNPAYGFMSNITLESEVEWPTDDFPEWPNKYKTFSWGLSECKSAECYHRFMLTYCHPCSQPFPENMNLLSC